jgi:hypothetical protein
MVSFPRPDIAKGIFFEYLRTDDPMSTDFRDHVVDGFPFLLSPLSQVKGIQHQMASKSATASINDNSAESEISNPSFIVRFGDALNFVHQQVDAVATAAKVTVIDAGSAAFKGAIDGTKWIAISADSKRRWLADQIVATPSTLVKIFRNDEDTLREISNISKSIVTEAEKTREWIIDGFVSIPRTIVSSVPVFPKSIFNQIPFFHSTKSVPVDSNDIDNDNTLTGEGNITTTINENENEDDDDWVDMETYDLLMDYMIDEIGGPIRRTIDYGNTVPPKSADYLRQFFVSLGHLYLLLMFIVSFPGSSYSTHVSSSSLTTTTNTTKTKKQITTTAEKSTCADPTREKHCQNQNNHKLMSVSDWISNNSRDGHRTHIDDKDQTFLAKNPLAFLSSMPLSPRSLQPKIQQNQIQPTTLKKKRRRTNNDSAFSAEKTEDLLDPSDCSTLHDESLPSNIRAISSTVLINPKNVVNRATRMMVPKGIRNFNKLNNDDIQSGDSIIRYSYTGTIVDVDDRMPKHYDSNRRSFPKNVKLVQKQHHQQMSGRGEDEDLSRESSPVSPVAKSKSRTKFGTGTLLLPIDDEVSNVSNPLKKKSLSYFL